MYLKLASRHTANFKTMAILVRQQKTMAFLVMKIYRPKLPWLQVSGPTNPGGSRKEEKEEAEEGGGH